MEEVVGHSDVAYPCEVVERGWGFASEFVDAKVEDQEVGKCLANVVGDFTPEIV